MEKGEQKDLMHMVEKQFYSSVNKNGCIRESGGIRRGNNK